MHILDRGTTLQAAAAMPSGGPVAIDDSSPSFMHWIDVPVDGAQPRRVWIDVGAHRGEYTFHRAAADPDLTVFAFEPNLEVIRHRIGKLPNFVVLPYAVSETDGSADFFVNSLSFSSSLNHLNPARIGADDYLDLPTGARLRETVTRTVPTIRLDTFLSSLGIDEVEFLKVDAQGHDLAVLKSAGLLLRDIKMLVVEASVVAQHQYLGSPSKDEIVSFLAERGFALTATETQTAGEEENLTFVREELAQPEHHATSAPASTATPRVTVVVPTRNRAPYLRRTIDSILSQDYPNVEVIVVDGDSDDGSQDILASYGEQIRYISEPDRGPFDAINKGWFMGSGEILAWLNADDVYEPHAIRRAVAFLEANPDVAVVYGACGLTDEDGRTRFVMPAPNWDLEVALRYCNHILYQAATFMRREQVEAVGWLYPAWTHDHELWLRIAINGGKIRGIPFQLASARVDQPDTYEGLPSRYGPAKVELTRRIFALETLPPPLRRMRRRAMSNSYARGLDYFHARYPHHWWWALKCFVLAVVTDPANLPQILSDIRLRIVWRLPAITGFLGLPGRAVRPVRRLRLSKLGGLVRGASSLAAPVALVGIWLELRKSNAEDQPEEH